MTPNYLGETAMDISTHPEYKNYTGKDWAMHFIHSYGQIEGDHHSKWVLDQVARAMHGGVPTVKLAKWDDGQEEYRVSELSETKEYLAWIKEMLGEEVDGEYEYDYDEGIAP